MWIIYRIFHLELVDTRNSMIQFNEQLVQNLSSNFSEVEAVTSNAKPLMALRSDANAKKVRSDSARKL